MVAENRIKRIANVASKASLVGLEATKLGFRIVACVGAIFLLYPAILSTAVGIDFFSDSKPVYGCIAVCFGLALFVVCGLILSRWASTSRPVADDQSSKSAKGPKKGSGRGC